MIFNPVRTVGSLSDRSILCRTGGSVNPRRACVAGFQSCTVLALYCYSCCFTIATISISAIVTWFSSPLL